MARPTRVGAGDDWLGKLIVGILGAVAVKVVVDELSLIAEHGIDNWRRHRFGA